MKLAAILLLPLLVLTGCSRGHISTTHDGDNTCYTVYSGSGNPRSISCVKDTP